VVCSVFWRILSRMAGALAAACMAFSPAQAQRISFLRDAEVENTIRAYATPVFTVAGLSPSAIGVHIVNDKTLNAFVANGLNLYINSGLLIRSENAGQVIGVIAHETGHISGGHLARIRDGMEGAMAESIVAMVLGAAIMAAGGGKRGTSDAGTGVMVAGQQAALRDFLRYTREMESSADQAGVNFLERAGLSARGLQEFLNVIASEELLAYERQDPYVRTHPISSQRVDFVRNFVANSRNGNKAIPAELEELHRRMKAKLIGYLEPARALQLYKENDTSIEARYARAIAYSRRPDYGRALSLMDDLLRERPNDAYFLEAKAQTLMEAGRIKEALPVYVRAADQLPNEPLITIALAHSQLESGQPELLKSAIANLERARQQDSNDFDAWRFLAIAYGRDGQEGMAALAQAELETRRGQRAAARTFADRAEKLLPRGTPAWQRAEDVKNANQKNEE
jgi:predicted Zn-dependent protease